ncbi:hypothetical protein [Catellatospora methionotrophica]|uniref:hypothetical protein n=1 Tax=Catellatospora methionotrophica TaxID=121620 RepID=UPI0033EE7216
MGKAIPEREFAQYADAQAAYGTHLLSVHRREATGCCRQCGRVHPCDLRMRGAHLIAHYADWWTDQPDLVRPYAAG